MDDQTTGLLSHFERLHQVDHAHLFKTALDDARTRCALLQFLQVQSIDDFFRDADEVFYQKWLGDEVFDAIDERAKALFYVGAAGHEQKRDVAGLFAATPLFKKLAAVE